MAGHMECIGIPAGSADELSTVIGRTMDQAAWEEMAGGGRMGLWRSSGGARMPAHVDKDGAIQCATPSFDGVSRLQVRPTAIVKDPDCPYCDLLHVEVLDSNGQMVYPLPLQIDDIGMTRNRIRFKEPAELRIAAFAEELQLWPDEQAFEASQKGAEPRFASRSLIPSGLFGPAPNPHALITGAVRSAEARTNEVSGAGFMALVVDTFGGTYDVVATAEQTQGVPRSGAIVQGNFWLVGRILKGLSDPPPPRKKRFGWFR
jgi:hypothetical protein